ncbi:MAG: hypothetical protein RLY70_4696 [Planctomycetota bacterium]
MPRDNRSQASSTPTDSTTWSGGAGRTGHTPPSFETPPLYAIRLQLEPGSGSEEIFFGAGSRRSLAAFLVVGRVGAGATLDATMGPIECHSGWEQGIDVVPAESAFVEIAAGAPEGRAATDLVAEVAAGVRREGVVAQVLGMARDAMFPGSVALMSVGRVDLSPLQIGDVLANGPEIDGWPHALVIPVRVRRAAGRHRRRSVVYQFECRGCERLRSRGEPWSRRVRGDFFRDG